MEQLSLDGAVEYLQAHPDEIRDAWVDPSNHLAGQLFEIVYSRRREPCGTIGCLTQIKSGNYEAQDSDELTAAIRADDRIPSSRASVTSDSLPVFAEWQKRIEEYYRAKGL